MGQIIKGKPVADAITETLVKDVEELVAKGINPKLKIVRVGAKDSDLAYEKGALSRMKRCNIIAEVLELQEDITQEDFVKELKGVSDDESVHGILLFRPLPEHLNMEEIKFVIDPRKDVDCMHPVNEAKVYAGDDSGYPPCTAQACVEILDHYGVEIQGTDITVVGSGMVVGKPLSMLLLNRFATTTVCHIFTKDLKANTKDADVVIVAVGKAGLIKADMLKEGAVVVDVGINVAEDGSMCGDVLFDDECVEKVSMITPVPGGVGAVTTSVLAKHVVQACKIINDIEV